MQAAGASEVAIEPETEAKGTSASDGFLATETCIDCFCSGAALYPHRADHSYRVIDCLDFPLFSKDWAVSDELLLLEGAISVIYSCLPKIVHLII